MFFKTKSSFFFLFQIAFNEKSDIVEIIILSTLVSSKFFCNQHNLPRFQRNLTLKPFISGKRENQKYSNCNKRVFKFCFLTFSFCSSFQKLAACDNWTLDLKRQISFKFSDNCIDTLSLSFFLYHFFLFVVLAYHQY